MQLIGQEVEHASYGQGEIIQQEDQRIEVRFANGDEPKKFLYPDAFEKFLSMNDPACRKQVEADIEQMHEDRREEKEAVERRYQEERAALEAAKKPKKAPARKSKAAKAAEESTEE
ncbi:hypothetical protein [Saccharibacillus sacchari]|uniref:Uncharacterized protein n=1 Tax=Saccharibacillus sacchari TaxID=456493 RepID=A0ACC6PE06_9BACL